MLRAVEKRPLKAFHIASNYYRYFQDPPLSQGEFNDLLAGVNLKLLSVSQGQSALSGAFLKQDSATQTEAQYSGSFFLHILGLMQKANLPAPEEMKVYDFIVKALPASMPEEAQNKIYNKKMNEALRIYYRANQKYINQAKALLRIKPPSILSLQSSRHVTGSTDR